MTWISRTLLGVVALLLLPISVCPARPMPLAGVWRWRKVFETCKRWGLNHMRFHSWTPPKAAFEAADELGFYLQVEPGMWNEINPGSPMERMLYEETDRIIKAYGNHPSFMLMSASHEPKGKWQEALSKWVEHYRRGDSRRLYTTGTGHTEREIENLTEGTDYLAVHRIDTKMLRRETGWYGRDYRDSLEDINLPVIAHEVGQWAAYPDYEEVIKKFSAKGYLRPFNLEIFRDSLKAHGLIEKNRSFAYQSGRASGNPVMRQLRFALLKYARSDCFQPQISVAPEQIRGLLFDTQVMKKLGAVAHVDGESANAAIDGDPNTFMVVGDRSAAMREQVDLTITLSQPVTMSGVVLMSRQNHREHEGDIRGYVLQVSDDGREWREVARGELLSTFAPQQIDFSSTVTARYLKLISLSGFGVDKRTALAELAVITDTPRKKAKPKPSPARPKP